MFFLAFSVNQPEKMDILLLPKKHERKEVVVSKALTDLVITYLLWCESLMKI